MAMGGEFDFEIRGVGVDLLAEEEFDNFIIPELVGGAGWSGGRGVMVKGCFELHDEAIGVEGEFELDLLCGGDVLAIPGVCDGEGE